MEWLDDLWTKLVDFFTGIWEGIVNFFDNLF